MKLGYLRAWYAIPVGLTFLCASCSGNPPKEAARLADSTPASNYFVGTRPVYAHLVGESGGSWVFTTVTASDSPADSSFLVRINDLTPAFDIRVAECAPQVYPDSHRCSPSHPFRNNDTGMLDKIINGSIAVGTAGKVTDISPTYETEFDEASFNRAVDEALLNTGLDATRHQLIMMLEEHDAVLGEARSELAELTQRAAAAHSSTAGVMLKIQPSVSGLIEYYEHDIDFDRLVDLKVRDGVTLPAVTLQKQGILPCDARNCLGKAESALASLRQQISVHEERMAAIIAPDAMVYDVRCEDTVQGSYFFSAQCPAVIEVSSNQAATLHVAVNILSRDFDDLYPVFDLADDRLSIHIDEDSVTFANATSDYITLTAQTVYYNSQAHTTSVPIDLPPGISITRQMSDFVSLAVDVESSYRQMTPDKAAGASFQFGFAVRYRIASLPEERTLHDLGSFNVGCVIENRIQPGSCKAQSVADARQQPIVSESDRESFGPM